MMTCVKARVSMARFRTLMHIKLDIIGLQDYNTYQLGNEWNLVWMPSDFPMVFLLRPAGEVGSASGRASVQSPCARQDLVSCHLGSC